MAKIRFGAGVVAVTMLAIPMFASTAQAAPASISQSGESVGTAGAGQTSWGCDTNPTKNRFNTSYNPGSLSTTVYYNNHCSHSVKWSVVIFNTKDQVRRTECAGSTPAGASGKKKFSMGLLDNFEGVNKGC
ncbi:hypothetical protein GCM10015535_53210 [Streptomyces gelaticus]|uniref:Uncharacterized protein n=1 Tax=Streptomyces gelaticus TaxID=285446 RepID=A0ABQ2W4Q5_9ACTN|nr:hypothetical protein [Streptomyces gelaticus]GGV92336.1 hypothetical protein GCM10015535_53210 [Streptomyces gelaticus]